MQINQSGRFDLVKARLYYAESSTIGTHGSSPHLPLSLEGSIGYIAFEARDAWTDFTHPHAGIITQSIDAHNHSQDCSQMTD